ncbi:hypothetical protein [Gaetbulibacter jejuensis]|uniref:Uncharacterized protein n=1 Tax=Gaetbulibacter jejuensis TaxID=584607 RepID=A0ABN1JGI3_9FLAO
MKTLELNQMENVQGGQCEGALETLGLGTAGSGTILSGAALYAGLATGPIGWAFLGLAAASFAIAAASCSD